MSWKKIVVADSDRPNKQNPAGRVCADENCNTVLSIYNSGQFCGKHSQNAPVELSKQDVKGGPRWTGPKTPASERRFDAPRGPRPKRPPTQTFDELWAETRLKGQLERGEIPAV